MIKYIEQNAIDKTWRNGKRKKSYNSRKANINDYIKKLGCCKILYWRSKSLYL